MPRYEPRRRNIIVSPDGVIYADAERIRYGDLTFEELAELSEDERNAAAARVARDAARARAREDRPERISPLPGDEDVYRIPLRLPASGILPDLDREAEDIATEPVTQAIRRASRLQEDVSAYLEMTDRMENVAYSLSDMANRLDMMSNGDHRAPGSEPTQAFAESLRTLARCGEVRATLATLSQAAMDASRTLRAELRGIEEERRRNNLMTSTADLRQPRGRQTARRRRTTTLELSRAPAPTPAPEGIDEEEAALDEALGLSTERLQEAMRQHRGSWSVGSTNTASETNSFFTRILTDDTDDAHGAEERARRR